jgi:L-iditol 2-dehydrogenase
MKVARTVSLTETVIEEVPDPVCGPGEVVCRVLACATCGSDVQDFYVSRKLPAVLGHEPAGEVVEVGAGVTGVRRGDRVAIHHHTPCGECRRCRRGHETLCERFRSTRIDPGGFAEYVRVEAALVGELLPLDGMDPVLATFTEPLACALRAQRRVGLEPGDALLVVGAGASGLLNIAAAHARGVEAVWVREPADARLRIALDWGAERHGNEPVDAALVCTPADDAVADAAAAVAPGGVLCLYAPPRPGAAVPLDGAALFRREITVTSSFAAGPGDMVSALELLRRGRVDAAALISHRVGLEDTPAAFSAARSGEALKALVTP